MPRTSKTDHRFFLVLPIFGKQRLNAIYTLTDLRYLAVIQARPFRIRITCLCFESNINSLPPPIRRWRPIHQPVIMAITIIGGVWLSAIRLIVDDSDMDYNNEQLISSHDTPCSVAVIPCW